MEKRLLIIDDNKEIVQVISEVLLDLFDIIDCAYTVEEAQENLIKSTHTLIFLDINLENRNGAEVVKFLNESPDNPNKNVPIIIISGIITPQFIERYQKRFAAIFMKPFNHDDMKKMVQEIIEVKDVLSPDIPSEDDLEEVPYLKCALPFPIFQLEEKVNKVLDQVRKSSKLKHFFAQMKIDRSSENYILSHIGTLINISTAICIQMEWNTDKTLEKFVFASYLHDMGLANSPDLARINTFEQLEGLKDTLSSAEYKAIFEHPNIAANSIEDMSEIPPDVGMIIRQHHELPNGSGYPTKCGHKKIAPLTTVFIVAHDLTEYILANPKWNIEVYIAKVRSKFHGPHFSKILRSLSDIK